MSTKIGNFALRNSVSIITVRFALAILGILALFSLPREQYPDVPLYYAHILVPYPGATAQEIEKEITQKVEEKIQGIQNIDSVVSLVSNGLSFTRVSFVKSISEEKFRNSYQALQASMNNLKLPANALNVEVDNFTYLDFLPITNVIVSAPTDLPYETLMKYAEDTKDALRTVDGIAKIGNKGLLQKQVRIALDKDSIQSYGISSYEIIEAIKQRNVSVPVGLLQTATQFLNVRLGGEYTSLEDIENTVIRTAPKFLQLKDIATVQYYFDDTKERVRFNGKNAVELKIYKTEQQDSISLVKNVRNTLDALSTRLPNSVQFSLFADTTKTISSATNILLFNALIGFILLFLSLLLFLGIRSAFIAAVEIPFTFVSSFFVLKMLGITLNSSTLFALVLVLGMLVDHGIVILENIVRLRHFHQHSRRDAVVLGVGEVAVPVITSTLTTVGTFLPLVFMPGFIGKFLLPVPVVISVVLIISTISALVVIPIHYMEIPRNDATHELSFFIWGRRVLRKILDFAIAHRIITAIISVLCIALAITSFFFMPVSLYDTEDQPFFFVDITMPSGISMQRSDTIIRAMEKELLTLVDGDTITGILTMIGNTDPDLSEGIRIDGVHNAQFQIEVRHPLQGTSIDDIMQQVKQRISKIGGPDSIRVRKQRTGPPSTPAIGYRIIGDNVYDLETIDTAVRDKLATYDELYNIKSNFAQKTSEFIIDINEVRAAQYGLSVAQIGGTLRHFIAKDSVGTMFLNNNSIDIVVTLGKNDVLSKDTIPFLTFPTKKGTIVPFASVASFKEHREFTEIHRENGKRVVNIQADALSRDRIRTINNEITAFVKNTFLQNNATIRFEIGGEFDEFAGLLENILLLLLVGVAIVYVILTAQFKNYIQPLLIMLTIMFTAVGISGFLTISGTVLSISVLYAFVALVGVVVNGAIVLISTSNNIIMKQRIHYREAIKVATVQRFKPVLLTNITTIIGVLPTALGIGGRSPIWQPMAMTIATGLLISTVTTLLVIPVFYAILPNPREKEHIHAPPQIPK